MLIEFVGCFEVDGGFEYEGCENFFDFGIVVGGYVEFG